MMWLEMLVVALLALELTDSPFLVSFTFFLRFLPMLFGFGLGVLAERLNRKYLMIIGLVILQGACGALVTASERLAARLEWDHYVAGTLAEILSNT